MPLTLVPDSTTRSVSEGILGENKQPQPLADASGYNVRPLGSSQQSSHEICYGVPKTAARLAFWCITVWDWSLSRPIVL